MVKIARSLLVVVLLGMVISASAQDRLEVHPKAPGIGLNFSVDYLFRARLDDGGENFAAAEVAPDVFEVLGVTTDPSSGFRYGLSYTFPENAWDLALRYQTLTTAGSEGFVDGGDMGAFELDKKVRQIDIEAGRSFVVSDSLAARAFIGLRRMSLRRTAKFHEIDGPRIDIGSRDMEFKGFGLRVGLDSDWRVLGDLSVYNGLAISLLNGDTDITEATYFTNGVIENYDEFRISRRTSVMATELKAGLAYALKMGENAQMNLRCGYEFTNYSGFDIPDVESQDMSMRGWVIGMDMKF